MGELGELCYVCCPHDSHSFIDQTFRLAIFAAFMYLHTVTDCAGSSYVNTVTGHAHNLFSKMVPYVCKYEGDFCCTP